MLFMIAAYLRPGAEEQLINYHAEFNEHIGQSAANVPIAGALRGPDGRRVGYLAFVEGDTVDDANTWLHESPHYQADLYERIDVFEYQVEVGRLS
jgi:uncharacterized protein YciI